MNRIGHPQTLWGRGNSAMNNSLSSGRRWRPTLPTLLTIFAALFLTLVLLAPSWAGDGDLDPNFNPGSGVSSAPMLWGQFNYTDASGKMIITGSFREMGGEPRTCIARVFADGTLDTTFNAPVNTDSSHINGCILLNPGDPNSQVLICGDFSIPSASGTYYGVARLNHDGSVDSTFGHAFTSSEGVETFGLQSSGKIMVGGFSMSVSGFAGHTYYLLRLAADGSVDTTYPMRSAPGGMVSSLWIYSSSDQNYPNQVRLFGDIPRFSDPTHLEHMLRLSADGTTVLESIGDEVVNNTIRGMAYQGNNIVIFGPFTQVHGTSMRGIARLLPNGALDTSFSIGTGANGFVQRVTTLSDGKLVLCGYFNSFSGTPCGYLVKLNNNGSVDTTFQAGDGADDRVWSMNLQGDGSWYIFGAFRSFNGSSRQCLARLNNNGSLDSRFASFTTSVPNPSSPKVLAIQHSVQGFLIGGAMSQYGGKLHRRLARVNIDGTPDGSFRAGLAGTVYCMSSQADGKVVVGGHFGVASGYESCTSLTRINLDGSTDLSFRPLITKADGTLPDLYMVDALDNGQIVIGGDFAYIADASRVMQPRSAVARLNPDGSLDPTFNAQITIPDGTFITVKAGGVVNGLYHVAGYFRYHGYNGFDAGFYTRLTSTGAVDTTFGPTASQGEVPHINIFLGEVRCGVDQSDGKVIVGGDFTRLIYNSLVQVPLGYLARFTSDGLLDTTFAATPGANGPIYALERQWPLDKVFFGGAFTSYNGVARNNLGRINPDGSLDTIFNSGVGPNDAVYAIQWDTSMRKVRIGGAFSTYNGVSRLRIAQLLSYKPTLPLLLLLQ
jgi:uncharacterized delta-60 repeat protein